MNLPINTNSGELTMSSLDLRDIINAARKEFGEPAVRNDQFVGRVEDELEGELGVCKIFAHPQSGAEMRFYDLTIEQCTLVGMRESKGVRRQVVVKLKEKEQPRQLSKAEMTLMVIGGLQSEVANQKLLIEQTTAERDHAIKTKAQISSSREASVMGKLSAAKRENNNLKHELGFSARHASMIAVEKASGRKFNSKWQPLKKWCKAHGVDAVEVHCPRWGKAQAWPAGAWLECYGVDLVELFGAEVSA